MNAYPKRTLLPALALLVLACLPALSMAEPVGGLLPFNDAAQTMMGSQGKSLDDVKNEIPSVEEVGLPVYPGAYFTGSSSGTDMMPSVILASADSMEQVKAWYAKQEGLTWHEMFGLFHVGDKYKMMQTESVYLQDISDDPSVSFGGLIFDMSGMQTQITISYKPKQAAGSD